MESCWTITIDLLFSKEEYLIHRFVILVCKIFHKLEFSVLEIFLFASSECLYLRVISLKNTTCFLSSRVKKAFILVLKLSYIFKLLFVSCLLDLSDKSV